MAFQRVFDGRARPVRGLWQRGKTYYAQLRDPGVGRPVRIALRGAETVPQAIAMLHELQVRRRSGAAHMVGKRAGVTLEEAVQQYMADPVVSTRKRATSLERERMTFLQFCRAAGSRDLGLVNDGVVDSFIRKRAAAGVSGRTINVDISAINSLFRWAADRGLRRPIFTKRRPLPFVQRRRTELLTRAQVDALAAAAEAWRGPELRDYVRLMSLIGSRATETAHLMWSEVDFENRKITIGLASDKFAIAKYGKVRVVPMNPPLEALLRDMKERATGPSLFPTLPDGRVISRMRSLPATIARRAGIGRFGWHHLRHYFISQCVMAGIDFMTIAKWVGHSDGGVLIGKVYGHITDSHSVAQAARLAGL